MTNYEAALFLHIVGVSGMFAGIGITMGVLHFARKAPNVESVRALVALGALGGRAIPILSLVVLVSGVYMVEDVWDWDKSWINISLAAYIVLFAMGPLINARRTKAIGMEAGRAPDGPIPEGLRRKLDDPILQTSEVTMNMATLGIVYLMVVKPDTAGSLIAMAVAVIVGLALSSQAWLAGASSTMVADESGQPAID